MRILAFVMIGYLAACAPVVTVPPETTPVIQQTTPTGTLSQRQAVQNFNIAVARVEPVAERLCRSRTPSSNCDFHIVVDTRPGQASNAFQTLDRSGRPILGFTVALIADARNVDEIAFVMAHEAAHHIEGHIARKQTNAQLGGVLIGSLASALGATDQTTLETAARLGASVGARSYSKEFELDADALGTRIAASAGFDPRRGAQFFFRVPDPGDRFLGTHPANADRLRTVERVAAGL